MGHVYTLNPAAGVPTGITVPDDGVDTRQAGSLNVPIEALGDAIAALYRRGIARAANPTALAALGNTAPHGSIQDLELRFVPGYGLYYFSLGSVTVGTPDNAFEIPATDASGVWFHSDWLMLDASGATNGYAAMGGPSSPGSHKILVDRVPWGLVDRIDADVTPSGSWAGGVYDTSTYELLLTTTNPAYKDGDVFVVTVELTATVSGVTKGFLQLTYGTTTALPVDATLPFDSGTERGPIGGGAASPVGTGFPTTLVARATVGGFTTPGQFTVALGGKLSTTGAGLALTDSISGSSPIHVRLEVYRP